GVGVVAVVGVFCSVLLCVFDPPPQLTRSACVAPVRTTSSARPSSERRLTKTTLRLVFMVADASSIEVVAQLLVPADAQTAQGVDAACHAFSGNPHRWKSKR